MPEVCSVNGAALRWRNWVSDSRTRSAVGKGRKHLASLLCEDGSCLESVFSSLAQHVTTHEPQDSVWGLLAWLLRFETVEAWLEGRCPRLECHASG